MDWLDLHEVQRTLRSLLQHHSLKASILCSAFFVVQLSDSYMTNRKTIALTLWTFVSKVMSLLLNTLSMFVIAFLPRSCSVAKSSPTICDPMDYSNPGFPVPHDLPEFALVHVHWISDTIQPFILCRPLLLPSIFPSIRVFSSESALPIRWPQYWSFSFSLSSSKESSQLISWKIDRFDLPRSLLILWLLSLSTVILEPKKIKHITASTFSPLFAMKWWDWMPWSSFLECWALSQLFHSPLLPSSWGSLVPLQFFFLTIVNFSTTPSLETEATSLIQQTHLAKSALLIRSPQIVLAA